MNDIYITGTAAVVPQNTSGPEWIECPSGPEDGFFKAIEPPYTEFLNPLAMRRMSRTLKNGLTCGMMCLKDSGISQPDAIITATGYGCLEDTATFLDKVTKPERQVLNPTPFIQSTHNAVAGVIALQTKCNGYNNTFTQRGFSFESALTEAMLMLKEEQMHHVLLGGMDELTRPLYQILMKLRDLRPDTQGMVPPGEGTIFLMISSVPSRNAIRVASFSSSYKPGNNEPKSLLSEIIRVHGVPDLVLTGANGYPANDKHYNCIMELLPDIKILSYKRYCGEYPTAPAFAHWMACEILKRDTALLGSPKSILIYNHFENRYHSFTLLKL